MKLVVLAVAGLALAGCVEQPAHQTVANPQPVDWAVLTTKTLEVPGYGLCTFAGVEGDWSDSMVLIGCEGKARFIYGCAGTGQEDCEPATYYCETGREPACVPEEASRVH